MVYFTVFHVSRASICIFRRVKTRFLVEFVVKFMGSQAGTKMFVSRLVPFYPLFPITVEGNKSLSVSTNFSLSVVKIDLKPFVAESTKRRLDPWTAAANRLNGSRGDSEVVVPFSQVPLKGSCLRSSAVKSFEIKPTIYVLGRTALKSNKLKTVATDTG